MNCHAFGLQHVVDGCRQLRAIRNVVEFDNQELKTGSKADGFHQPLVLGKVRWVQRERPGDAPMVKREIAPLCHGVPAPRSQNDGFCLALL